MFVEQIPLTEKILRTVARGSLEPGGQLVLTLKHSEQGATKVDIAEITARLSRIEELLGAAS